MTMRCCSRPANAQHLGRFAQRSNPVFDRACPVRFLPPCPAAIGVSPRASWRRRGTSINPACAPTNRRALRPTARSWPPTKPAWLLTGCSVRPGMRRCSPAARRSHRRPSSWRSTAASAFSTCNARAAVKIGTAISPAFAGRRTRHCGSWKPPSIATDAASKPGGGRRPILSASNAAGRMNRNHPAAAQAHR